MTARMYEQSCTQAVWRTPSRCVHPPAQPRCEPGCRRLQQIRAECRPWHGQRHRSRSATPVLDDLQTPGEQDLGQRGRQTQRKEAGCADRPEHARPIPLHDRSNRGALGQHPLRGTCHVRSPSRDSRRSSNRAPANEMCPCRYTAQGKSRREHRCQVPWAMGPRCFRATDDGQALTFRVTATIPNSGLFDVHKPPKAGAWNCCRPLCVTPMMG